MSIHKQGRDNKNLATHEAEDEDHKTRATLTKESATSLKHQPDIDGPQQASQETDDVYADTRQVDENLPPAGKNVGDLNVNDLNKDDK